MNRSSSQSCSSFRRTWKYEVFLSFRGEDTRNNFTDHLFSALQRKGIFTFRDDKRLKKGDSISPELLKAIEQSRISIVVFSKNYASSTWCLEELAKISEGINEPGYTILPIFYDVDPSEVRKQSENYERAFSHHEERFKDNLEKVNRWRQAMTHVASLPGWDVQNKKEAEVIDEIVKDAIGKLGHKFSTLANDLVGMQSRVEALENLLYLDSNDHVRVVGIWGVGGIGKTTLAAVVFDRISHRFDASCFLADVSEVAERASLVCLQKQLLRETLKENLKIRDDHKGTNLISTRLRHLKILIVLDHVDHSEQLEKLAGESKWFGDGSRIIITTRDERILIEHRVKEFYKAELLNDNEALQLLCRKVFRSDNALRNFQKMSQSVLEYAQGLPLAITVLGSYLFCRTEREWDSVLARLKYPEQDIMKILEISFMGLNEKEKEIFLDIACFFKGAEENYVMEILDHCGFHPAIGIRTIVDKSLINIVNGKFWMHDLLQELGWKLARRNFPEETAKWSRLWLYEDFCHVMWTNLASIKVEAIVLNLENVDKTPLRAEAFSKMSDLRLLIIQNVNFSGNLEYLSNKLRYLSWHKYPFTCLPSSFEPCKLANLIMANSRITQLWEGIKVLPCLRSMNLRDSKNLLEMPDFRGFPNLEKLDVEGCIELLHLDLSVTNLLKLTSMSLKNCTGLIKTPDFRGVPNLERLDLGGCTGFFNLDSSIKNLPKLKFLNLRNCINLVSVPNSLFGLSSLENLNLAGCLKLGKCLDFDDWRSSIEVKVLGNQDAPFLEVLSYYILISFPERIKNNKLAFGCLSCLISP